MDLRRRDPRSKAGNGAGERSNHLPTKTHMRLRMRQREAAGYQSRGALGKTRAKLAANLIAAR